MTKTEFKKQCVKDGVTCAYSGHNKTFYVSGYPNGMALAHIQSTGYQVEKSKNQK